MPKSAAVLGIPSVDIVDEWHQISLQNPRNTVFQSPHWVLSSTERETSSKKLLISLEQEKSLLGMAPFFIERRKDSLKHLRLSGGDYEDIAVKPGRELEGVQTLLCALREHRRHWDLANFKSLMPESVLMAPFINGDGSIDLAPERMESVLGGLKIFVEPHHRAAYIRLPETWKQYESVLGKKLSWQLGYEERRRHREFASVEINLASKSSLESELRSFYSMHSARRLAKGYQPHFDNPITCSEFLETSKSFLALNQLQLYTLVLDGIVAGAIYLLTDHNRIYFYGSGFKREFEKHGPIKALLMHAIKEGINKGFKEFDFLKGEGDYRDRWATDYRQLYRMYIANDSLKSNFVLGLKKRKSESLAQERSRELASLTMKG